MRSRKHLVIEALDDRAHLSYVDPQDPWWVRAPIHVLEVLSGKKKLEREYEEVLDEVNKGRMFWEAALDKLDIDVQFDLGKIEAIPKEGPLIFIANHPFGVVDGLMICLLAHKVRGKFKVLVHNMLFQTKFLTPFLLPIEFQNTKEAIQLNIETRKEAIERLQNGELVVIFPSGGVATSPKGFGKAVDLDWKLFVAKMLIKSKATIIPIFFHGQNSRGFQLVSQVSQTLRMGMLLNEVMNKRGKTLQVEIGNPIPYEELAGIKDRRKLIAHLRTITLGLGSVKDAKRRNSN